MKQLSKQTIILLMLLLLAACSATEETAVTVAPIAAIERQEPTVTPTATATATPTITPTATATPTATITPTASNTPLATATPTATPLPANGPIVFACFIRSTDQICRMNADGSDYTQLTSRSTTSFYPSLSPDGRKVVFSGRVGESNFELFIMNADGSNLQQLSNNWGNVFAPEISPDGQKIVFTSARATQSIAVYEFATDQVTWLTDDAANDLDPAWSPDSSQIVFASGRAGPTSHYIINADGSSMRQVNADGITRFGGRVDWSPDGKWLAVYAGVRGNRHIYRLAVDGSGSERLTQISDNTGPSYSPDGNFITFASYRDGEKLGIYRMNADGGDVERLTFNSYADWQPRWGNATR